MNLARDTRVCSISSLVSEEGEEAEDNDEEREEGEEEGEDEEEEEEEEEEEAQELGKERRRWINSSQDEHGPASIPATGMVTNSGQNRHNIEKLAERKSTATKNFPLCLRRYNSRLFNPPLLDISHESSLQPAWACLVQS